MAIKERKHDIDTVNSISFLFENDGFSWIKPTGKGDFSKKFFQVDQINSINGIEKVVSILKNENFFDSNYGLIDISIHNDKLTLIPLDYFDEDTAETFLNYNVSFSKEEGLRFNLIPQLSAALIFYYSEEIENIFADFSDKLRITHTGFKFISNLSMDLKDGVFLYVYQKTIEVVVIKDKKLQLYNIYPYNVIEDIAYFLQLIHIFEISSPEMTLFYFGRLEDKESNISYLSKYFKGIERGVEDIFKRKNFTTLDLL